MSFQISIKYILTIFISVLFTWILHEFTHWLTSTTLGYDSVMRLNSVSYINPEYVLIWHKNIVSASGPLITILQAFISYKLLYKKQWNSFIYPYLYVPFYMRALAGIMNMINPNDEGRVSLFLNLGLYTLPILVCVGLFYLVYKTAKYHQIPKKFQIITILSVMCFTSILILGDQILKIQLIPFP